ncbi:shikimate dehydrogenase [soil metagenome]
MRGRTNAPDLPEASEVNISGKTRLLGVIGHPISHSLSPLMHNAAFTADGADYVYVALDVAPERLESAVSGLASLGFVGFNVTMPHKENIIPMLDQMDESARISGAVNAVLVRDGGLYGMNTDGSGFVEACSESGIGFAGKRVLLLGAGGAAAAVAVAVLGESPRGLTISNRTVGRAEGLAEKVAHVGGDAEIAAISLSDAVEHAAYADVIVNTTYLGMKDHAQMPIPAHCLGPDKVVCDAVYLRGEVTELIRRAREAGARTLPGGRMLLYQGVQAQRIWTGREPNVGVMDGALS